MADTSTTIGWLGTGRMGFQLVRRLLAAGYDVTVYNRTRAKAEPLQEYGARVVDTPVELADRDVVFSMVSASKDLHSVMLGENGLLTGITTPRVICDSSTVSVEAGEELREAAAKTGTAVLATPVSGNPKVIESGKLTVAASGPRSAFEEAEPLLRAFGRGVTYVGEGEVARLVKIAHNVFLGVVTQSLAEITVLAEKGGVSREAFLAFLNDSVMGSVFSRYKTPAFVNLDFTATFTMPLLQKDFDLGLHAGDELGVPMPIASATRQIVAAEAGAGNRESDFATL
ncbi:MAG TPA: NAD(P)-dependent oxidoreductase, partial [Microbacteriaceae bacterium]|nr:NAD(P)-dependent oxidoreductase [Microbacteriaceae bacterium]